MASLPQTKLDRLAGRWHLTRPVACKLGQEPLSRRGGTCSTCPIRPEFEVDEEIGKLVENRTFRGNGACPYRLMASHLVAGLVLSPEAFRARSKAQSPVDPVLEIKGALRRLNTVTRSTSLSRDDIEALCDKDPAWEALLEVHSAQALLKAALAKFQSLPSTLSLPNPKGRTGALHIQALARATASAWRELTGRLPAKDNTRFHNLLSAAVATVFGDAAEELNLESATRTAVDRIRQDATKRDLMRRN